MDARQPLGSIGKKLIYLEANLKQKINMLEPLQAQNRSFKIVANKLTFDNKDRTT
jgi:hypothetical protein